MDGGFVLHHLASDPLVAFIGDARRAMLSIHFIFSLRVVSVMLCYISHMSGGAVTSMSRF